MAPPRPPDILRKSHSHSEGKSRSREKRELERELEVFDGGESDRAGLLLAVESVVLAGDGIAAGAAAAIEWLASRSVPHRFVIDESVGQDAVVARLAHVARSVPAIDPDRVVILPAAADTPDAERFAPALERLGLPARAVWLVDSDRDRLAAAARAGLGTIAVGSGGTDRSGQGSAEAGRVVETIADLPRVWEAPSAAPLG